MSNYKETIDRLLTSSGVPISSTRWLGDWVEVPCTQCGSEILARFEDKDKATLCWVCSKDSENTAAAPSCDCGANKSGELAHYRWCSVAHQDNNKPGKII